VFGLIDPDRSDAATGRFVRAVGRAFAGRRFRGFGDVDWASIIAAGVQGTVQVAGAAAQAYTADVRARQQQQQNPCAQWPGSYFDQGTGRCVGGATVAAQPGGFNIDPTTIAIGAGVVLLVLVVTSRRD
jgi:hypothetical protein